MFDIEIRDIGYIILSWEVGLGQSSVFTGGAGMKVRQQMLLSQLSWGETLCLFVTGLVVASLLILHSNGHWVKKKKKLDSHSPMVSDGPMSGQWMVN